MPNRRNVLELALGLPVLAGAAQAPQALAAETRRDLYADLGIPTLINAGEPFTNLGGAPVRPEVKAAMDSVAGSIANIRDVQNAVGERIASLLGCEAAMVTAGAASALTLGTAACITGSDPARIKRIPELSGLKDQVVIQKAHRYDYEHAVRNCGVTMIEVETLAQMEAAIGPRTACLLFNNRWTAQGLIKHEEFVAIGRRRGVPTFNDCASDAPPASNLTKFQRIGFDLVTFSGGKGLRASSSSGLLFGRRDLIEAAKANASPNDDTIGRGMKVSASEMVGLLAAVELCLAEQPDPLFQQSLPRLRRVQDALADLKGLAFEVFEPPVSYREPHLRIRWDQQARQLTADEARRRLREGPARIITRTGPDPVEGLELTAWMVTEEQMPALIAGLRRVLG